MPEARRVLRARAGRGRQASQAKRRTATAAASSAAASAAPRTCRGASRTFAGSRRAAASPSFPRIKTASGDLGVYDLKTKTITLLHNVTVAQGKNVLHGERVVVDTVSGNAHFDSNAEAQNGTSPAKPPGRVRAVILPNKDAKGGGPANTMSIGPLGRPAELGANCGAPSQHGGDKSAKVCSGRREYPGDLTSKVPGLRGLAGVVDIFSYFRRRGAPSRQPALTEAEEIDLASMGGVINGTYLDIASGPAARAQSAQQATPAAHAPPQPPPRTAGRPTPTPQRAPAPDSGPKRPPPRKTSLRRRRAAPPGRKRRGAARAQGRARRAWRGKDLRRPQGGQRRQPLRAQGRGGRVCSARTVPARPRCST